MASSEVVEICSNHRFWSIDDGLVVYVHGVCLPRPRRFQTGRAVEKTKEATAVYPRPGLAGERGGNGQWGLAIRLSRLVISPDLDESRMIQSCVRIGLIRDFAEPGAGYRVMCLGLGSLSELSNARVQLVFLQLVLQHVLDVVSRPLFSIRKDCEVLIRMNRLPTT